MAITNKIGPPVIGEDFYGRRRELEEAHRYLTEKQSLLLSAPRRIGKSSFAHRLLNDKKAEGWHCIYIDLEGIATKENFLKKIMSSFEDAGLLEKALDKFIDIKNFIFGSIKEINLSGTKIDLNNIDVTQSLFNRLSELFDYENNVLIVIDELSIFLGKLIKDGNNIEEVDFLLNWFRSIRQRENSNIRWIFCGSVGLRNFTNHYHLSKSINDLVDFDLGEFSETEAAGLISSLAQSYNIVIDEETTRHIITTLQWPIPYFIQLLISRLLSMVSDRDNRIISHEDVDEAYNQLTRLDYFKTWYERLDEYDELQSYARNILDNLSASAEGLSKESLNDIVMTGIEPSKFDEVSKQLTKVLNMLEHDGYIMRTNDNRRKFRSPLLKQWWKYKFVD